MDDASGLRFPCSAPTVRARQGRNAALDSLRLSCLSALVWLVYPDLSS